MKLISLNVAMKMDNAQEIGKFIKLQNPDFVAYQEMMRHFDEKVFSKYKSEADIEKIIKFPYKFFGPKWITRRFMSNGKLYLDFGGLVEQGNEITSKFPIISAVNEHFYQNYSLQLDGTNWITEDEPRSVIIAEFNVKGKRLQILNLHGIWSKDKLGDKRTLEQCKYVIKAAKRKNIPTIIVGDFNLLPDSKGIKLISRKFRNLTTEFKIKSTRPKFDDGLDKGQLAIDYIFVNDKIKVNDFEVIETRISDHLPLVLDFDIL